MKILKYLLIILALLSAVFFGNGLITSEIYYESSVVVNAPVTTSWDVMSDSDRISEWLTSIDRIEVQHGGENQVGTISHIYVVENGEEMMMEETITAVTPYELMAMTFTMDFMDMDYEMTMKEVDGQTHIHTKTTTKGNGLFAKSILSFMISAMEAQEVENLGKLKSVIEAES